MFQLRCTVRNCQQLLQRQEHGLFCAGGHHFDASKQGYWNLLQPQDKRSSSPGDSDSAVEARHRWLLRGHSSGLVDELRAWTKITPWTAVSQGDEVATSTTPQTLDLGCGEGTFGVQLFCESAEGYCGIDLSKRAIKLAVRQLPTATWVLSNADRILPAADESVHRVISLFGRRPVEEIRRVLVPGGSCIVAVPAEEDLIELREQVQEAGHRRSRTEPIIDEFAKSGIECIQQKQWEHQVQLGADAIADALAMTYRAVRHSQQARLEGVSQLSVTLAAELLLFKKIH